ncbi:Dirigent protein 24 [Linum grandiflorum]
MAKLMAASCSCLVLLLLLLLVAAAISSANAARILDELNPATASSTATIPTIQIPAAATAPGDDDADEELADPPLPETEIPPPAAAVPSPVADEEAPLSPTPVEEEIPIPAAGAPALSFFMHDILGGSRPSARVVAGIIARTDINGIPFSVPNNNIFPLQGGTPLLNPNNINNLINPNTAPLMTGLNPSATSGQANTVLQNAGSSGVVNPATNSQPFVTAGQLPAGLTLQKLMFGSITVFDDELTEGHELGSAVLGRAQGFYLASSVDGTSHTMSMTLMMHEHEGHEDTISFFGVHRNAAPVSSVAVVGGTGKYEDAKGYATIEAIQQEDQHVTDGVDTITHINVYLSV